MSTPTRADEPFDESVRNLLWRLRARLVSPPAEQQVQADLERLLDAASAQAHDAPSAGADERPDLHQVPAGLRPEHPVGRDIEDAVAALRDARRHSVVQSFGRVAAASLIVVAVATGIATARDGSVTLQALFGREGAPAQSGQQETDAPALAAPEASTPEVEAAPEVAGTAPADPGAVAVPPEDDDPASAATEDDATAGEAESAEASESVEAPVTDEVLAAPPLDGVDGFGGPQPCEEADLADCLPDDEPTDGLPEDDGLEPRDPADTAEELAKRRFGGGVPVVEQDAIDEPVEPQDPEAG